MANLSYGEELPQDDAARKLVGALTDYGSSVNAFVALRGVNLQIQNAEPVADLAVAQDTHDALNANANLQVGDADVAADHPVPVEIVAVSGSGAGQEPMANSLPVVLASNQSAVRVTAAPDLGQIWFFAAAVTNVAVAIAALVGAVKLLIYNNSGATIYIGDVASVTTANGYPIPAGGSLALDTSGVAWGAIAASAGPHDVRVLELA